MSNTKQHTEPFETCVSQVVEQGHDKGSAFAICTDAFKKAGKPIFVGESEKQKLHLFCESFKLEGNKVSGVAIHPKRIFHPEEDMVHVYLRDELKNAAPTGAGKPFGIDHIYVLPQPNLLTKSWYCPDEDGICFEGFVDDYIAEQIRKKKFKGISIEINWLRPGGSVEYVNGVAPRNFELTSVHFLKQFPPGDPDAFVKLWEQVAAEWRFVTMGDNKVCEICAPYDGNIYVLGETRPTLPLHPNCRCRYERLSGEQLVVGPPLPLDQRVEALEQQLQAVLNEINVINGKLDVLTGTSSPSAIAQPAQPGASQTIGVMKMKAQTKQYGAFIAEAMYSGITVQGIRKKFPRMSQALAETILAKIKEAEWDTEYKNKLPDSAFAVVAPGGEKDEEGKTVPRDLRKLPHHNAEDNLDLDHLRNALGRVNQIEPADLQAKAKKHLCGHARGEKAEDLVSEFCGEEQASAQESLKAEMRGLRKKLKEQEPEKDVHGCLIGKQRYDEEQDKCLPITAEARAAFLEAKMSLKEQEGELTIEQIKAKIAELAKQREELDKKLWPEPPESGLSEEEKAAIRTQIDVIYAEIDAYEQALKAKVSAQAAPPETAAGETEIKKVKESLVALRKKVVAAEAMVLDIEKRRKREAGMWKEKYEKLREAVKGAIPPPRIWKSWTPGPQRYVQENLKILRDTES